MTKKNEKKRKKKERKPCLKKKRVWPVGNFAYLKVLFCDPQAHPPFSLETKKTKYICFQTKFMSDPIIFST